MEHGGGGGGGEDEAEEQQGKEWWKGMTYSMPFSGALQTGFGNGSWLDGAVNADLL